MQKFLAATAMLLISATTSLAGEFSFPSDAPVATVSIPDSWQPSETEYGVEATSDDGGTYISFDIAGDSDMDAVMTQVFDFLSENGVEPDPATQKDSKDTLNGMPFEAIDWTGKDKDGPVSIGVGIIGLSAEKIAIVTYWASAETEERNMPEVGKILATVKPVN
ncbi:histidine kinase [Rhizobium sp. 18065]|uniref:histidine kinase n=1 Tax=Rhizobium sp. 18065 TaxID=2681411 RepID=UPI001358932F|nr:histidine kinase [Rhizobium sp. 18065]